VGITRSRAKKLLATVIAGCCLWSCLRALHRSQFNRHVRGPMQRKEHSACQTQLEFKVAVKKNWAGKSLRFCFASISFFFNQRAGDGFLKKADSVAKGVLGENRKCEY
jgi:hypothetical protein